MSRVITPAIRCLIGDRTGRILGEVEPMIGPVSWRLNEVSKVSLQFVRSDPKTTERMLRFGNRVLLQFDNGLPAWGGVIEPPEKWNRDSIEVTAFSGEYLLGFRQTDRGRYFSGATIGYIFQSVIVEGNAVAPMGVEFGSAWGGGNTHSPDYHFKGVLDIVQGSLLRFANVDFAVLASEEGGRIVFRAHLYERRGQDRPGVALVEGRNVTDVSLVRQGRIVNSWDLAGEGTTWGADTAGSGGGRPFSHEEDGESIALYGLRQDSKVFGDTSVQETLDATAQALLEESKDVRSRLALKAVDLKPGLFGAYDVGDRVWVQLPSYGWNGINGLARVEARVFDSESGECEIVVEELV